MLRSIHRDPTSAEESVNADAIRTSMLKIINGGLSTLNKLVDEDDIVIQKKGGDLEITIAAPKSSFYLEGVSYTSVDKHREVLDRLEDAGFSHNGGYNKHYLNNPLVAYSVDEQHNVKFTIPDTVESAKLIDGMVNGSIKNRVVELLKNLTREASRTPASEHEGERARKQRDESDELAAKRLKHGVLDAINESFAREKESLKHYR